MALLFTDTTYDINVGILDDEFRWVEFRAEKGQKASAVLQAETHRLCRDHGVKPQELKGIVTMAGPGFYTGLRLSEGFADIFKAFGVPGHSFYSYEIPRWCGVESGVWVTKAYRGEYFFHEWNGESSKNLLVSTKELPGMLERFSHVHVHSASAMDQELKSSTSTLDLLKANPEAIFKEVVQGQLNRESFYFRAPEDEFRVST